ncbi:hypothetical protein Pfo_014713 [Paulownia fortunei]|nr:hypothetical protein Pfo_014713 [Paulownia fortunei]
MSRIYDNWERLVAAVLRREQLWLLCHAHSRSSSFISSLSSDFSSSFSLNSPFHHNPSFNFANPKHGLPKHGHSLPFQALARINISARPEEKQNPDLIFFDDSPFTFEVETLLKAPSNNLGDEIQTFGESFVVSPGKGFMVVVKRFMISKISLQIFEQQMKIIGSIEHENLVKPRGYFLSQRRAFVIYDFFSQGSVSSMLYGKRNQNRVQLDWDIRIRIATGAARGLAHIHRQCDGNLVHGNIKASNVFLNSEGYGCLAYPNLPNFLNPSAPTVTTLGGYSPPEVASKVSQASDVYSFGVLLLELLSGKSPMHIISRQYGHWARYNARDDWTVLVFDTGLLKIPTIKEEMQDMLNIALSCVEDNPEKRRNMESVVEMLEHMMH